MTRSLAPLVGALSAMLLACGSDKADTPATVAAPATSPPTTATAASAAATAATTSVTSGTSANAPTTARITFTADRAGTFEVESHETENVLVQLEVS